MKKIDSLLINSLVISLIFDINLYFSNSLSRLILIILILNRILFFKILYNKIYFIYFGLFLVSIYSNFINSGKLIESFLIFEQLILLVVFIEYIYNSKVLISIFKTLYYSAVLLSIFGILEFFFYNNLSFLFEIFQTTDNLNFFGYFGLRPKTIFINPIFYSFFLGFSLVISFFIFKKSKFFRSSSNLLIIIAILLSESMGTYVLLFLVLTFYLLHKFFTIDSIFYFYLTSLFFILISFSFLYSNNFSLLRNVFTDRIFVWEASLNSISQFKLFGIGLGNFNEFFINNNSISPEIYYFTNFKTHNDFLKFFVETGLFGGLLFSIISIKSLNLSRLSVTKYKLSNSNINLTLFYLSFFIFNYLLIENFFMSLRTQFLVTLVYSLNYNNRLSGIKKTLNN